ncbi:MAG: hypothetical protein PHU51_05375 [Candidatus Nanoarchaeia archaeon]|nr:hypothetical protein [Candidatus Nanoarchaeia archaeon]
MIDVKISPELNFAHLVRKNILKSSVELKEELKHRKISLISEQPEFDKFLKFFKDNKEFLDTYCEKLIKIIKSFKFSKLSYVEEFFGEKFPEQIDIYVGLGNSSRVTFGKNYGNFYLLLPRGFPKKMTPQKDFQVIIHELIHSLHYKKPIERKIKNKDFFEYVVTSFAPEGILFGNEAKKNNLDSVKLKKIFELVKNSNNILECYAKCIKLKLWESN